MIFWQFVINGALICLALISGIALLATAPDIRGPIWLRILMAAIGVALIGGMFGAFCFALAGGLV